MTTRSFRLLLPMAATLLLHACAMFSHDTDPGCAGIRWEVKTMADARAREVDTVPLDRTVAQLITLPHVQPRLFGGRHDDELRTFRVTCEIQAYKIEGDGDVHLVIRDPHDTTARMIAEIPDPRCPQSIESGRARQYADAKRELYAALGPHVPSDSMQTPAVKPVVEIVGVGFYDIPHFQGGAAPNDLELHPVLALKKR